MHERSIVPLVLEDMVVMNVVACNNVRPVAGNHSSLPHLAVEEDLHLRADRQHSVGRGVQLDVVLDVVTSIGNCHLRQQKQRRHQLRRADDCRVLENRAKLSYTFAHRHGAKV